MLRDYVSQCGEECIVVRNDKITISGLAAMQFDSILISPGPCSPADAGITPAVIQAYHATVPILGICLGHQALGQFYGAALVTARSPMHGKTSSIIYSQHPIFSDIPQGTEVMRYHSLILEDIPADLAIIAQTNSGEVMGIAHRRLKVAGLQFHPESILTTHGLQMIRNWFAFIK